MWEVGGEHWQGGRALPTGVLGKGRNVSEASRHGRGFRELNEIGIFLEKLGQNPVCIAAPRSILIIQPSE